MRHVAKQESRTQKRSARQRKTQTGILLKYTPIPPPLECWERERVIVQSGVVTYWVVVSE